MKESNSNQRTESKLKKNSKNIFTLLANTRIQFHSLAGLWAWVRTAVGSGCPSWAPSSHPPSSQAPHRTLPVLVSTPPPRTIQWWVAATAPPPMLGSSVAYSGGSGARRVKVQGGLASRYPAHAVTHSRRLPGREKRGGGKGGEREVERTEEGASGSRGGGG
jgi:hypothetical protein